LHIPQRHLSNFARRIEGWDAGHQPLEATLAIEIATQKRYTRQVAALKRVLVVVVGAVT